MNETGRATALYGPPAAAEPAAASQQLDGGSVCYGLARSSSLSFWESFLYSTAGTFAWEIGGERTNPSINDMIETPIGGSYLGEALIRMASLVLEVDDGRPVSYAKWLPPPYH